MTILTEEHALPAPRACGVARLSRTAYYRAPAAPTRLHDTWAMDCMGDSLSSGRADRLFNVLDEGNREALAIEVDVSLPSIRVIAVLEQRCTIYGKPRQLRCDNGPEFVADAMNAWGEQHGIPIHFIEPGKPNQHADIERFNNSVRTEVLDAWVFTSLDDVRDVSEPWRHAYNTERSHESLGRVPPLTFLPRPTTVPDPSNFTLCA